MSADDRVLVFSCPEHAPSGVTPESNDDGRPICSTCGRSSYAVKPYRLPAFVIDRGYWRTDTGEERRIIAENVR